MTAPLAARAAPVRKAITARGMRRSQRMDAVISGICSGSILPVILLPTIAAISPGVMETLPTPMPASRQRMPAARQISTLIPGFMQRS